MFNNFLFDIKYNKPRLNTKFDNFIINCNIYFILFIYLIKFCSQPKFWFDVDLILRTSDKNLKKMFWTFKQRKNIMKIISIGIWVFWTEIEMENCSQCTHMNRVTNEDMYGMQDAGSKISLSALHHFLLDAIFERNEIASLMAESHISSMYS